MRENIIAQERLSERGKYMVPQQNIYTLKSILKILGHCIVGISVYFR